MSRPSKRPRLHFLASISPDPDGELAIARARNDGLLKTRWEHIFARYEKDFDGVGDEISMLDDEIVVDNGHIKSMQNAQDTGVTRLAGQSTASPPRYDGRRLLRAMTVAPSEDSQDSASDDDADEVLLSIETIADNIIIDDESSDDDLFDIQASSNTLLHSEQSKFRKRSEEVDIKSESDCDPLFNTRPVIRSPSVDDLFCTGTPLSHPSDHVSSKVWIGPISVSAHTPDTSLGSVPPRDTIDRAFIREEIRKALEEENQAQEAQIETAWRIPVRLVRPRSSHSISGSLPVAVAPATQTPDMTFDDDLNDDNNESLWKMPSRTRRSRREVAAERSLKRLRAESEDPLQDGFTSDTEQASVTPVKNVPCSASQLDSHTSVDSSPANSPLLSLREWQKLESADSHEEDDSSENERVDQRPSKKARSFTSIAREIRRASKAPSSASDTIIVRVPQTQRTIKKGRPGE